MANTPHNELKLDQFWNRMERNSVVVERMPDWVKGAQSNQRPHTDNRATNERPAARPSVLKAKG